MACSSLHIQTWNSLCEAAARTAVGPGLTRRPHHDHQLDVVRTRVTYKARTNTACSSVSPAGTTYGAASCGPSVSRPPVEMDSDQSRGGDQPSRLPGHYAASDLATYSNRVNRTSSLASTSQHSPRHCGSTRRLSEDRDGPMTESSTQRVVITCAHCGATNDLTVSGTSSYQRVGCSHCGSSLGRFDQLARRTLDQEEPPGARRTARGQGSGMGSL